MEEVRRREERGRRRNRKRRGRECGGNEGRREGGSNGEKEPGNKNHVYSNMLCVHIGHPTTEYGTHSYRKVEGEGLTA